MRTGSALIELHQNIDRAIAVLQAMDECIVARNAISIIKRTLSRAKIVTQPAVNVEHSSYAHGSAIAQLPWSGTGPDLGSGISTILPEIETNGTETDNLSWLDPNPFDNFPQSLFWTTWAQEVSALGL